MEITKYLESKLKEEYSCDINRILSGYDVVRKTTFRVNSLKSSYEEIKNALDKNFIKYEKVNWYKDAFIIDHTIDIRNLDIYKQGKIYVQSLSSMLPVLILDPKENESVLDMAAAPGSKTTMIASLTNNKCRIMANEKDKIRYERLKYNINMQGLKNINVSNNDALKLDEFFRFDKILLDVPCSGSGTINENNIKYFSEKLVLNSQKLQISLLKKAISLLKVGGTIVYSTCSILKEENELVLNEVLKNDAVKLEKIDLDVPKLFVSIDGTICVCPTNEYEGFFVAKLTKIK